jgi:hypothetical protein
MYFLHQQSGTLKWGAASQGKMVRRVRRKAPARCGLGEKSEMASSETYLSAFPPERQIEQRCADSNAFRWYLGIDLDERVSRTDPEAGHMKRSGKPRGRYHLSHQTTDTDCGIITGVTVTPGDVSDSAYDLPLACRVPEEHGKEG